MGEVKKPEVWQVTEAEAQGHRRCTAPPAKRPQRNLRDMELPQSIIESLARFLVSVVRKYYESEQGQREFGEWQERQNEI